MPEIHFLHLKTSVDGEPPVWRRVRIATNLSLRTLHDVLQAAMGRAADAHEFRIGKRRYGPGVPDGADERRALVGKLLAPGDVFEYVDDGARRHRVEVERWSPILPDDARVLCLDGGGDGFDAEAINQVLAAWWERPPTSALN